MLEVEVVSGGGQAALGESHPMGGVATRGARSAARSPSPPLLRLLVLLGAVAGAAAQADAGGHGGGGGEHEPAGVWGPLVGALCMLLIGGTAAGLTIGLLSTDVTELELTMESGPPDKRRKARKSKEGRPPPRAARWT